MTHIIFPLLSLYHTDAGAVLSDRPGAVFLLSLPDYCFFISMPSSRLWRVLLALLLLAALFCVPSLVLTGSEWLPELTGAVENYVPFWKGLLRFLIFCAWCWVWLWTEGSALQILLALLLQFCGIWALCLLRPRPASRSHSHA